MKRLVYVLSLVLLLSLSLTGVQAQAGPNPADMAQYVPAEADFFMAFRTDDGLLDMLQGVVDKVISKLPPELNVPPVNLREALAESMTGVDYADLRAALGDAIAFSVGNVALITDKNPANDSKAGMMLAIQVADRDMMGALLTPMLGSASMSTQGDFTLYEMTDGVMALGNDVLFFANSADILPMNRSGGSLADDAAFIQVTGALPEDRYSFFIYANLASALDAIANQNPGMTPPQRLNLESLGSIALGMTIVDGRAGIVDVANATQLPPFLEALYTPVDPAFVRYIPANTDIVLHGTNLAAYLQTFILLMDAGPRGNQDGPSGQIARFLRVAGIDMQADILETATGDFVVFGDADFSAFVDAISSGRLNRMPLNFGLVVEMTDARAAEELANKIGRFIATTTGNTREIQVGRAIINGTRVTNISLDLRSSNIDDAFEIMIGAKDNLFFVASSEATQHITGGIEDLTGDAVFNDAARYILPNAAQVWYMNDEGLLSGTVIPLALLGPAIGNIFDNIVDELQQSALPSRQTIQFNPDDQAQQFRLAVDTFKDIMASGSLSIARSGDVLLTRLVLALE